MVCLRALGRQGPFCKERRMMASGNGLPSPTVATKRPSPLGPFPRHIWIHQDTPQDSLDKTCHEIWKRAQGLPEAFQPRTGAMIPAQPTSAPPGALRDHDSTFQDEALEQSCSKDEISLLVEQEYLNLTKENLSLARDSPGELDTAGDAPELSRPVTPPFPPHVLAQAGSLPPSLAFGGDQLLGQKKAVGQAIQPMLSGPGDKEPPGRPDCDSVKSTVTGILRSAKGKGTKGGEEGIASLAASNSEISKLLAQFPLKHIESSKAPDNKMVLEETRVIKDFLQNSMFSGPGPKEPSGSAPLLPLPPPPLPALPEKAPELPGQKRQLPVFAKICSKPEADPSVEGLLAMERTPSSKELVKAPRDALVPSQWPQSRKDMCSEEGTGSSKASSMFVSLPSKKPPWPTEKNLLYEFLGAAKNPDGQLRLRSKTEVEGLELKFNAPMTIADKNNLKYTGNVFTPRFATALTSTALNQPLWLNLNYPPPPVFTNHSTFPQYQVTPYNPQQMGQQIFRSSYTPLLSYIPFVQPGYSYPQRTPPKLSTSPRDPSPMAGDGPQYLFPQAYGWRPEAPKATAKPEETKEHEET
uniref:Chromosome 1 open reading frame 94 n=1 Tax=Monodelphis domestica TaxID=13616 RepID=A0A5F8H8I4_MONDO